MTAPPSLPPAISAWMTADERQQLDVLRQQLSQDVTLVSPLTDGFTFDGPEEVIGVLASAFELLRDIEMAAVTGSGRDWAVHSRNTFDGRNLEEIQWLHLDESGLIDRITIFIRPAPAAVSFLAKVGAPLHRRGVLPRRAAIASRAAAPLALALRTTEARVMPLLRR